MTMKYPTILTPILFFVMFSVLTLPGCGTDRESSRRASGPPVASRIDLSDAVMVKSILYAQYDEWMSVQYREGGLSRKGVDCSGFVYLTYRLKFGIDLPRTTDLQSAIGKKIAPDDLQAGDLVFFKTGFFQKHVGIFLEDGKFIHASTSGGVMVSSLDDQYWADSYWMAKRVEL